MKQISNPLWILSILFVCIQIPLFSQQLKIREGILVNLYDAFGKNALLTKDFGFSCITKYQGKTILFDAGSNADIFKSNTKF